MDLTQIVTQANLAPSVHNTQPTRWQRQGAAIALSLDPARLLAVGDPSGRDARFSLGAALEGTMIACAAQGQAVRAVELDIAARLGGPVARLVPGAEARPDPDAAWVTRRITWRGGFAPVADTTPAERFCDARDDAYWLSGARHLAEVAALNDAASLTFLRDDAFRAELLHWMRLDPRHRRLALDGLGFAALGMGRWQAAAAARVLRRPVFETLDGIGLGKMLVSEAAKTRGSAGVVLFHRPHEEDPVTSGRAFYRLGLGLAGLGLAAWPMAALTDDADSRAHLHGLAGLPDTRRLILCLRVGAVAQEAFRPPRARLPAGDLILP